MGAASAWACLHGCTHMRVSLPLSGAQALPQFLQRGRGPGDLAKEKDRTSAYEASGVAQELEVSGTETSETGIGERGCWVLGTELTSGARLHGGGRQADVGAGMGLEAGHLAGSLTDCCPLWPGLSGHLSL